MKEAPFDLERGDVSIVLIFCFYAKFLNGRG
jgi:hypothetical protein